ncbi:MAG TPA: cupin domain-containing protein [Terriglobia bacterium]|nr:cupin domain-containing protein [Terriglobia bacterium]
MRKPNFFALSLAATLICLAGPAIAQTKKTAGRETGNPLPSVRQVLSQPLPAMNGNHLRVILEEVNFGPGASAPVHTHPCPVIGYVAMGAIESKIKGAPENVFQSGQAFFEPANGVHEIARNASRNHPARLIAIHICDKNVPLSMPVAESKTKEGEK